MLRRAIHALGVMRVEAKAKAKAKKKMKKKKIKKKKIKKEKIEQISAGMENDVFFPLFATVCGIF